uniref:Thioredoxin domain-containing protein n=1 Tax=Zosterops lateralis melanops TaxID=1220523 RepID=A0A8D2NSQ2_ZOSLA
NPSSAVVDVFQAWCGPCKAVVSLFQKIRNQVGSDLLHFAVAEVDSIDALEKYRGQCEPVFLFYRVSENIFPVIRIYSQCAALWSLQVQPAASAGPHSSHKLPCFIPRLMGRHKEGCSKVFSAVEQSSSEGRRAWYI